MTEGRMYGKVATATGGAGGADGAGSAGSAGSAEDTAGAGGTEDSSGTGPARGYTIESLDTGLRLLRLFLTHDTLTVSEAAGLLSIGRSTAHRVLSTLEGRGFAVRESSGRGYSAGPELERLGRPAGFGTAVREQLGAVLDDALRRTGETVQSAALIGDRILVTDGRESPHPVRVMPERGRTHPAHATAGGKMLLSGMTSEELHALYPQEELPEVTPNTLTSRSALFAELDAIRSRGYALSRGESVPGLHAVAVAPAASSRRDRLALMASVPADRGDDAALARLVGELRRSAALFGPA
ncbi:IclR family transcriptional regulator [Streptomyces sp. NBC_01221]|uniref:IclR family transcriptional regulator n=1 Tax=unclassified Streptomyces TaxID=2593676 RepID=UPI00225215A7|nr:MULTISPECIES: IclR family transcriptional regulator [unclassified Streptomyces]WSP58948.1 IclR family transcriptional regulator [Streptomyces sp. NBC_01241]WSU20533.1 IclR family transcriptional regulator [Streptomyces sp. NBC_01108]MCX4790679.1 IclR family transcriptional regulator [Streptomyces sp. NBC_01221]MCX4793591.1 IclR family transcriptional regulator [Streptomyces sp. NBC_01242]WSJ35019.1 IclR family transcriptional regulator [Streptomyces sp. NBC_01321]